MPVPSCEVLPLPEPPRNLSSLAVAALAGHAALAFPAALVGFAACLVPGRRALRVQPTEALREG